MTAWPTDSPISATERTPSDERQTDLTIERQLDAPISDVWAMWTEPEQFATWYGPIGAVIPTADFDLRVGGRRLVCMEMNGMRMWFGGEFLEIAPQERLVYTEFMSDERGALRPDMVPDGHPATTEVRIQLTADGDRTTVAMTHVGIPSDSSGAAGWNMAFDKLDANLSATQYAPEVTFANTEATTSTAAQVAPTVRGDGHAQAAPDERRGSDSAWGTPRA